MTRQRGGVRARKRGRTSTLARSINMLICPIACLLLLVVGGLSYAAPPLAIPPIVLAVVIARHPKLIERVVEAILRPRNDPGP